MDDICRECKDSRPILFTGEMIRAILDGRKTESRRVIKPQPIDMEDVSHPTKRITPCIHSAKTCGYPCAVEDAVKNGLCPYGEPGKCLWVRETFVIESTYEYSSEVAAPTDRPFQKQEDPDGDPYLLIPHYRATEPEPHITPKQDDDKTIWSPSIFMPHWASRILLWIDDIRVERVQDIDIIGVEREGTPNYNKRPSGADDTDFRFLWDSINKKRGFGWESNPWVWVITWSVI